MCPLPSLGRVPLGAAAGGAGMAMVFILDSKVVQESVAEGPSHSS